MTTDIIGSAITGVLPARIEVSALAQLMGAEGLSVNPDRGEVARGLLRRGEALGELRVTRKTQQVPAPGFRVFRPYSDDPYDRNYIPHAHRAPGQSGVWVECSQPEPGAVPNTQEQHTDYVDAADVEDFFGDAFGQRVVAGGFRTKAVEDWLNCHVRAGDSVPDDDLIKRADLLRLYEVVPERGGVARSLTKQDLQDAYGIDGGEKKGHGLPHAKHSVRLLQRLLARKGLVLRRKDAGT